MQVTSSTKIRLGAFILVGILLLLAALFFIGNQKSLFDPKFQISTTFQNVSGLKVGNAVRFSGITIGNVESIRIVNDTTVKVAMTIKSEVRPFIRVDSQVGIGSEGIIGDRILTITAGSPQLETVKEGSVLASWEPTETDAIMESLQVTIDNTAIATDELNQILFKINSGQGTLGRLIQDSKMADNLDRTMHNLQTSSDKLDQNMDAAQNNILLKGYFNKKKKAEERTKKAQEKAEEKAKNNADRAKQLNDK